MAQHSQFHCQPGFGIAERTKEQEIWTKLGNAVLIYPFAHSQWTLNPHSQPLTQPCRLRPPLAAPAENGLVGGSKQGPEGLRRVPVGV